ALTATLARRAEEAPRVAALRDRLAAGVAAGLFDGAVRMNGDPAGKLVNNCHLAFPGVEAEALLLLLDRDGVCASAGSSCASGALEPSHVLAAMGLPVDLARSSVRLTLGWPTTSAGLTPNPCVECNRSIKFGRLLERAVATGFDAVATGHHARVVGDTLARGRDRAKDQSYVLYMLTRFELVRLRLPVGEMTKAEV